VPHAFAQAQSRFWAGVSRRNLQNSGVSRIVSVDNTIEPKFNGAQRFHTALIVSFGLWSAIFFWLGSSAEPFWKGYDYKADRTDYYNFLVDGFLSGHLAMKAPVDPDLLSVDPLVRSRAQYMLDATLYHGRYYLYYGVTPAAVLLYPYALLTGKHLSPPAACFTFIVVGFGVSVFWLVLLRVRLAANWQTSFAVAAVTLLAIVPGVAFLVRRSSFYDLPLAAGYMWMSIVCFSLWRAQDGKHSLRWLILASASVGLAVGCRTNLILLVPSVFAWPRLLKNDLRRKPSAIWISCLVPLSIIGAGLAWYNYARFGNPFDFGFWHGLNSYFNTGNPLISLRFFIANAKAYLFTPPSLGTWFPFDFPINPGPIPKLYSNAEAMSGLFPVTILAGWITATVFAAHLIRRTKGVVNPWVLYLFAVAAVELIFTFLLGIRAYRYATDFLTPVSFLLVLGLTRSWATSGVFGRIARSGIFFFGFLASLHVVLGSVQLFDGFKYSRANEFKFLSALANPQQATLEKWGAPKPGGITLKIRFSCPKAATIIPVVTTGLPEAFDSIRAIVFPNGYLRFEIFHSGYGGPSSDLIPIVWAHFIHRERIGIL
jgi:hypothetical protein